MLLPLQRRPLRKHARRDPLRTLPPLPPDGFLQGMTVYARAQRDPSAIFASMRQTVNQLDSNVLIYRMRTLEQQLDKSLMSERLLVSLRGLRTPRHAAGSHRPLRRDGLYGGAADAGNRHPHGARRKPRFRGLAGDARSAGTVGGRSGAGGSGEHTSE